MSETTENMTIVYAIVFSGVNAFFFATSYLFYKRRHTQIIEKRLPYIGLYGAMLVQIMTNFYLAIAMGGLDQYIPCLANFLTSYILASAAVMCTITKMFHLVTVYFVTMAKVQLSGGGHRQESVYARMNGMERGIVKLFFTFTRRKKSGKKGMATSSPLTKSYLMNHTQTGTAVGLPLGSMTVGGGESNPSTSSNLSLQSDISEEAAAQVARTVMDLKDFVNQFSHLRSTRLFIANALMGLIYGSFVAAVSVLAVGVELDFEKTFPHCRLVTDYIVLWSTIFLSFISTPVLLITLRKVKDDLWMRTEVFLSLIISVPCFLFYIIVILIDQDNYQVAMASFCVMFILYHIITIVVPVILSYRRERQNDQNKMDIDTFRTRLSNKIFFQAFKSYLTTAFCLENALFWEDYQKFKERLDRIQPGQVEVRSVFIRKQCVSLHRKYIVEGAQYELNIPSVKAKIVHEGIRQKKYSLSMYDSICEEVVKMMYQNNLGKFLAKNNSGNQD